MRMMLRGKVHRARVTHADLDYVGSVAIDRDLARAAGIAEWEQVDILDITNGARLTTYALHAPAGSGVVCINGAAAHLVNPGDLVIIVAYEGVPSDQADTHVPRIVHVDEHNRIVDLDGQAAAAAHRNIEEQITAGSR